MNRTGLAAFNNIPYSGSTRPSSLFINIPHTLLQSANSSPVQTRNNWLRAAEVLVYLTFLTAITFWKNLSNSLCYDVPLQKKGQINF